MPGSILGTEVRRVEDLELLLGQGTFVDNLESSGVAHAIFVRSPFAHARITGIDTSEAAQRRGVLAVFTADDLGREPLAGFADVNDQAGRGRRWPSTRSATSATRSPSSSPRPAPRRWTPPSWSTSTTTTCRR